VSDFFDQLERDLVHAASARARAGVAPVLRRPRWRRRPWGSLLLATILCVGVGAATAGGALYVLRGSVIPAPAVRDVPAEQLPVPGSSRLAALRARDPAAGSPPWTVRVARSRTGLLCGTVGQVAGGSFGLVGLDDRFRLLPERIVDACGELRSNAASLVGVRVFDAARRSGVRSAVYGVAGAKLRAATVTAGGQRRALPVAAGGIFLAVVRGYPEDTGVQVALRFADGHTERHPFGTSPFVVVDPAGGAAWRAQVFGFGVRPGAKPDPRTCVSFRTAREIRTPPISPAACGTYRDPRHRKGYFFAVRRITPGTGAIPIELVGDGHWGRHPARTAVWGSVGEDVRRIEIVGPRGLRQEPVIAPSRAFLAVFTADVDPAALRVRVTFLDGRVQTSSGDTHLVQGPRTP
jgi:hypothetical protein